MVVKIDWNHLTPQLEAVLRERFLEEKELELMEWLWRSKGADITIRTVRKDFKQKKD